MFSRRAKGAPGSSSRLGAWLGDLGRRLSLPETPPSSRDGGHCGGRRQSLGRAPPAASASLPTVLEGDSEEEESASVADSQLSYQQRHEINLLYHLLRDHRDELQLYSGCLLVVQGGSGARNEEGVLDDLCQWCYCCDSDESDCGGSCVSCCDSDETCRGKNKCDSDSCCSNCSGCSKRFKHQRRTDRWNQEYDQEFREKQGLVDRDYSRMCQIK